VTQLEQFPVLKAGQTSLWDGVEYVQLALYSDQETERERERERERDQDPSISLKLPNFLQPGSTS
jgi:hypothetical protein